MQAHLSLYWLLHALSLPCLVQKLTVLTVNISVHLTAKYSDRNNLYHKN